MLSTGSRRQPRPPPALKFEDEPVRDDGADFSAPFAAAVPSRRPPQTTAPRESSVTPTRRPAAFASVEEDDGFGSRNRPASSGDSQGNFEPVNKELFASFQSRRPPPQPVVEEAAPVAPASFHEDPYQTSFDQVPESAPPPRREPPPPPAARPRPASRSRLQVTSINVRPQLDLRAQEPDEFEIGRVQSQSAARSRLRTRTRQRTRARQPAQEEELYY